MQLFLLLNRLIYKDNTKGGFIMMRNKRILGGALLLSMSLLGGGLNMGFSNNGQPAIVKAADTKSQSTLAGWNTGKEDRKSVV